jgi:putative flippase GtrA
MAHGETSSHTEGGQLIGPAVEGAGVIARGWSRSWRLRRFAAVGVANTLVDYVLFIGITKAFSLSLDLVWVAKVASGTVAIANSFYLNRWWVFPTKGAGLGQAARFLAATIVGVYVVQTGLTHLFATSYPSLGRALHDAIETIGLAAAFPSILTEALAIKTAAFVTATSVSMAFNFVAYRFWVFRTAA